MTAVTTELKMHHLHSRHDSFLKLAHVANTTVPAQLLKSDAGVSDGGGCALAQRMLGKQVPHMISFYKTSFFSYFLQRFIK